MMKPPSQANFFRMVMAVTLSLVWLSAWDVFRLAQKLGFSPLTSKAWLALLGLLVASGALCLFLIIISFTALRDRLLGMVGSIDSIGRMFRWAGSPLLLAALVVFPLLMFLPYYGELLGKMGWLRLFLFWLFGLLAMQALKLAFPALRWTVAFLATMLLHAVICRIVLYLPDISSYPFAMGWSETSRFYWPALFVSKAVFGQNLAWPILHPSLHLMLVPPYLVNAPLWFHRFWQVALRFVLVGLIAPALLSRLKIQRRPLRWLAGAWIFLYLFTLPLYLHLAVPVFIMLWGFSARDERRTWLWLVIASIWAGLSRVNWYPVPGMLAAVLYFLEVPQEKRSWRYLIKPALWCAAGTGIAFVTMQVYIAFSGISNQADFYTSLSSPKLWDRLWPNASYALGVLPAALIFSAPLWIVLFIGWRRQRVEWGWPRIVLLLGALAVLFFGGLLVSVKIGGGSDIHNMDGYAVVLLIIFSSLFFGRHACETEQPGMIRQPEWHWGIFVLLVLVPAWFAVRSSATGFWQYDAAKSGATLAALQQEVDQVNTQGGQILFVTQRHLISMRILKGVKLVPEYEREELMEMAMAQNQSYLQDFRNDLEKHRFAAIVVDPLHINLVAEQDAMGPENNAWNRFVARRILCNYTQAAIFPDDHIAIYVPQVGAQQCP
jgi:hypothetical protein